MVNAAPVGCSALLGAAASELCTSRSDATSIRRACDSRTRPIPRDCQLYQATRPSAPVPALRGRRDPILPHTDRRRKTLSYGPGERSTALHRLHPLLQLAVQALLRVRPNGQRSAAGACTWWSTGCGGADAAPDRCSALLGAASNELRFQVERSHFAPASVCCHTRPIPRTTSPTGQPTLQLRVSHNDDGATRFCHTWATHARLSRMVLASKGCYAYGPHPLPQLAVHARPACGLTPELSCGRLYKVGCWVRRGQRRARRLQLVVRRRLERTTHFQERRRLDPASVCRHTRPIPRDCRPY